MFDYGNDTADSLLTATDEALAGCDALLEGVIAVDGDRTWQNTAEPLVEVSRKLAHAEGRVAFLAQAHPDAEVRGMCQQQDERIKTWGNAWAYRRDLYEAFAAYAEAPPETDLGPEQRRWLEKELLDYELAGHGLDDEARTELESLNERLNELTLRFSVNLAENGDFVDIAADELAGLPEPILHALGDGDAPGTKRVTMAYPDVVPTLQSVHSRSVRERVAKVFNNRCVEENRPLLTEALGIRHRIAELFGLPTWTDYRLQTRMAVDAATVQDFYAGLVPPLTKKGTDELAVMTSLLEADGEATPLRRHDFAYYEEKIRQDQYGIDQQAVAEYFELEATMDALYEITGDVFGLDYRQVEDARAWHEDVTLWEINDRASGDLIGHFYADLHPREGKYNHAAAFWPLKAHDTPTGRTTAVTAFLCNFPKPTAEQPSLLRHDDVVTLFHEFGHVLHLTLSKAAMPRFTAGVEWDFVEAPSQIMEHWCWTPEVLATFARHHATGEPIPAEMVKQLVAARDLNVALFNLRQIALGTIDQNYHGVPGVPDIDEGFTAADAVSLIPGTEGTFMPASFGHLMSGYDAGYYGYLWSKVYGDDMFSVFAAEGVTDPGVGMRYRTAILEPNGTRDGAEMLVDFLGREPDSRAFLANLGIG